MQLKLIRKFFKANYTIGELFIDGEFFCDTLEDKVRENEPKIINETAIPAGNYNVILSKSVRFGILMPEILDVPNFTGIRIHAGNTDKDTSGCILIGTNDILGMVTHSKDTFKKLMEILLETNSKITIEII